MGGLAKSKDPEQDDPSKITFKVFDRNSDEFKKVSTMQVWDPDKPRTSAPGSPKRKSGVADASSPSKKRKKDKDDKEKKDPEKEAMAAENAAIKAELAKMKAQMQGGAQQAPTKAESGSDSDSDSSSDDSSSESEPTPAPKASRPAPVAVAPAPKAATNETAKKFEERMRAQILKIADPDARSNKIEQIWSQMLKKQNDLQAIAGMTLPMMKELFERLRAEFPPSKAAPRQPKAPPPAHLMAKGSSDGNALPATPDDDDPNPNVLPHRQKTKPKPALAQPWNPKKNNVARISFSDAAGGKLIEEAAVESYKGAGETLWYTMPGAIVICDQCDKGVPQGMGTLQGAPNQSQFAQCKFLCSDCLGGPW